MLANLCSELIRTGKWIQMVLGLNGIGASLTAARSINTNPGSSDSIKLAQTWLDHCLNKHDRCPKPTGFMPHRVLAMLGKTPWDGLRVIESSSVVDLRRYAALSYCWGPVEKTYAATTAKMSSLVDKIEWHSLPATIKEALVMTFNLGLKYLWVDAICIIQDSDQDKNLQLGMMPMIYSEALFTIGASRSEAAERGFLSKRVPFEGCTVTFHDTIGRNGLAMIVDSSSVDAQRAIEFTETRAWCLQERVLSPRFLDFHNLQTLWHCNTLLKIRDNRHKIWFSDGWIPQGLSMATWSGDRKSGRIEWDKQLELRKTMAALQGWKSAGQLSNHTKDTGRFSKLYRKAIKTVQGFKELVVPGRAEEFQEAWRFIVRNYTSRQLSYQADKLRAISAVAMAYSAKTNDRYLAGLWQKMLPSALLWTRTEIDWIWPRSKEYRAPSWSWASVDGPIDEAIQMQFTTEDEDEEMRITDLARIIGSDISLESHNAEFGSVKHRRMKIRGHLIPARLGLWDPKIKTLDTNKWKSSLPRGIGPSRQLPPSSNGPGSSPIALPRPIPPHSSNLPGSSSAALPRPVPPHSNWTGASSAALPRPIPPHSDWTGSSSAAIPPTSPPTASSVPHPNSRDREDMLRETFRTQIEQVDQRHKKLEEAIQNVSLRDTTSKENSLPDQRPSSASSGSINEVRFLTSGGKHCKV